MNFPLPEISLPLLTILSVIVSFGITAWQAQKARAEVERLRQNDIHELTERLKRIETKFDQHLQFHMTK